MPAPGLRTKVPKIKEFSSMAQGYIFLELLGTIWQA
jgi:hypothetical protein